MNKIVNELISDEKNNFPCQEINIFEKGVFTYSSACELCGNYCNNCRKLLGDNQSIYCGKGCPNVFCYSCIYEHECNSSESESEDDL